MKIRRTKCGVIQMKYGTFVDFESRYGLDLNVEFYLQMRNAFLINIATNSGVCKAPPYLCRLINHPKIRFGFQPWAKERPFWQALTLFGPSKKTELILPKKIAYQIAVFKQFALIIINPEVCMYAKVTKCVTTFLN